MSESDSKVRAMSIDEFVEAVENHSPDVIKKAKLANVDVRSTLERAKPGIDKYGKKTGISIGVSKIKEEILEATSDVVKGIILGERDRWGSNTPIRIPVLSSSGKHLEVINWGNEVKYGDKRIHMPFPAKVELKVMDDGDYNGQKNLRVVSIESYETLTTSDAIGKLNKIAVTPADLTRENENSVVVVRGSVGFVGPSARWNSDKTKAGDWPVYLENALDSPKKHIVMQITLQEEGGNRVRATFDRQRNAVPTVAVEDLEMICQDAIAETTSPHDQARIVGNAIRGREVIVVGYLTKFKNSDDTTYIDVGASAIFDAESSVQTKLTSSSRASDAKDEDDDVEEISSKPSKQDYKKEQKAQPTKSASKKSKLSEVREIISNYSDLTGVDPSEMNAEELRKVAKLSEYSLSLIQDALEDLQGAVAA